MSSLPTAAGRTAAPSSEAARKAERWRGVDDYTEVGISIERTWRDGAPVMTLAYPEDGLPETLRVGDPIGAGRRLLVLSEEDATWLLAFRIVEAVCARKRSRVRYRPSVDVPFDSPTRASNS